jgi:hypothetical protein
MISNIGNHIIYITVNRQYRLHGSVFQFSTGKKKQTIRGLFFKIHLSP